ncbi:MAG TPA: DUF3179 domain-containing (seleno)protein [Pyrinomonadaceae bacterium]|nr:DUF3179 domain-containing (seleno)protein [Pyrinomonadaceae bacterium]
MAWLALLLLLIAAFVSVLTPAWLIQPFRPQTPTTLARSFALRRWSPTATIICAIVAFLVCGWLWRGARWWRKSLLVLALMLVCGAAWLARQNHFEWMFKPLPNPAYARVRDANFVADTDMVLAVRLNNEAVAYPVRQMAYHHVVADTVGGVPLVATY